MGVVLPRRLRGPQCLGVWLRGWFSCQKLPLSGFCESLWQGHSAVARTAAVGVAFLLCMTGPCGMPRAEGISMHVVCDGAQLLPHHRHFSVRPLVHTAALVSCTPSKGTLGQTTETGCHAWTVGPGAEGFCVQGLCCGGLHSTTATWLLLRG